MFKITYEGDDGTFAVHDDEREESFRSPLSAQYYSTGSIGLRFDEGTCEYLRVSGDNIEIVITPSVLADLADLTYITLDKYDEVRLKAAYEATDTVDLTPEQLQALQKAHDNAKEAVQ